MTEIKKREKTPFGHHIWKYFGAMMTETKNGTQAVSITRVLALVCFVMLSVKWNMGEGLVPDTLLYTFWGLLGGKTAESITAIFRGKKAG